MGGLGVVLLAAAMAALGVALQQSARIGRRRRRAHRARPGWLREPPLSEADAERRSLALLRSVVNRDEWDMFRELGFICVTGRRRGRPERRGNVLPRYRYLIYPHLPVVALLPRSMAPVREYCVQFPDIRADGGAAPLPRGDDVLAKWMTLRADEDRLLAFANVANAGCQIPLGRIERDLKRLSRWQAARDVGVAERGGLRRADRPSAPRDRAAAPRR